MKPSKKPITKVIDNFSGRLTRSLNGDMNSGYAKFEKSWGYDPFTKPGNLTWMPIPNDITNTTTNNSSILVIDAKPRFEIGSGSTVGIPYVYALAQKSGDTNIYKIRVTTGDGTVNSSVIQTASVTASSPTFNYGGSLDFFQFSEKIYVGSDNQINNIGFDGSGDALIATASPGSGTTGYVQSQERPMIPFQGKLLFGNGPTIAAIDATNTVVSSIQAVSSVLLNGNHASSEIMPALPYGWVVKDIEVSPDFNYVNILGTNVPAQDINSINTDITNAAMSQTGLFRWNGVDKAITAGLNLPISNGTAIYSYLNDTYIFGEDAFGMALLRSGQKIWTLPNNKSPSRNAVGSNGNFIFWATIERVPTSATTYNSTGFISLYYYGSFDEQTPPGLYRIMRQDTTLNGGSINLVPVCVQVLNKYVSIENTSPNTIGNMGVGLYYFSYQARNKSGGVIQNKLYSFQLPPQARTVGAAQAGVYETQTQLFSKKISVQQIRVYTEPTQSGGVGSDAFQLDLIGSDGEVITNGSFSYAYTAGTDITLLQGSLDRINFNPSVGGTYALAIRITNTGQNPMTIKKVEIDYSEEGK